ncbi:hypothetical protein B0H13DRAFT_1873383 [Mycena leptocephala]|nr:hypothetical protein B0H13DRAFT_1873383 [Mycena leptocephala]
MVDEAEDDRDVRGPMLRARIRDLMCYVVVMQIEDRSRPEIEGYDVYDRIYPLKANITERIYATQQPSNGVALESLLLSPPTSSVHPLAQRLLYPSPQLSQALVLRKYVKTPAIWWLPVVQILSSSLFLVSMSRRSAYSLGTLVLLCANGSPTYSSPHHQDRHELPRPDGPQHSAIVRIHGRYFVKYILRLHDSCRNP